MFLLCNGHVAVLLLGLMQSTVSALSKNEDKRMLVLADWMESLLQGPRMNEIEPILRSSEPLCADQLTALIDAFGSGDTWAQEMFDASSKLQSGILRGNIRDLGMYDQCVAINGEYNGTRVQGKHCTLSFGTLSSAVCVPSQCNETDIMEIVDAVISNVTENTNLELKIEDVSCVPLESEDFSTGEIVTICFFAAIGAFVLFCTICEFIKMLKPVGVSPTIVQLAKFSLYTNAMSVLSTEVSPRMMPAIQGIRFFSMSWVVLGHRYVNTLTRPMVNSLDMIEWYGSWRAVYIQAAPFAVDTFFVISGFLLTYLFLKSARAGKRTNYLMMYIHRYLRLTPSLGALMLFVAVLLHRVWNGPLWDGLITGTIEPCRKNWWVNLLYVQNFVRPLEMCLTHSWYLAVDMQLFWISPFILYPLHRWPKLGLGIIGVCLVASVVTPAVLLAINQYSNAVFRLNVPLENMIADFFDFYIPTYNRAFAYFIGILLGWDAANQKRNFRKRTVVFNWVVTGILMLICVLITKRIYSMTLEYDVVLETLFAIVLRPFWSIAIAWIVYACTYGYGGILGRFFSLPIFLPLSRLSYSIYLVHLILILARNAGAKIPSMFSDIITLNYFWVDLIWSILLAFVFCLFFESPVVVLEKILTAPRRKPAERRKVSRDTKKDVDVGIDNKGMTDP